MVVRRASHLVIPFLVMIMWSHLISYDLWSGMGIQELITQMMGPGGVPVADKTYGFTRYKRLDIASDDLNLS